MTHRVFHDRVIADASQCSRDGVLRRCDLEGLARRHLGARNLGFPCRIRGHIGRQCLGSGRPWIKRFAFWSDD